MPISIETRYKLALDQLQFASSIRFKILAAWGAVYVAMGTAFVWVQSVCALIPLSGWISLFTIGLTILLWAFDYRNGAAIGFAKKVGKAIEEDSANEIPEGQRYFSKLNKDKSMRHGIVINIFTIGMIIILGFATIYLFSNRT